MKVKFIITINVFVTCSNFNLYFLVSAANASIGSHHLPLLVKTVSQIWEVQNTILSKLATIEAKIENVEKSSTVVNPDKEGSKNFFMHSVEELVAFEEELKIPDKFYEIVMF